MKRLKLSETGRLNIRNMIAGIERFLRRNPDTCFGVEKKGVIAGAIIAGSDGHRGYIYHTAVSPEQRR